MKVSKKKQEQENSSPSSCTSNKFLLNGKLRITFGDVSDSAKKRNIFKTKKCFLIGDNVKEMTGTSKDNFAEVLLFLPKFQISTT
jgi:hypothetical protein